MRQVGLLSKQDQADRFADFLRGQGIRCNVDSVADGYRVWVIDDDHISAAKEEMPRFLADPNHERYRDASRLAQKSLQEEQQRREAARSNTVILSDRWRRAGIESAPVTVGLIAIAILVVSLTGYHPKEDDPLANQLWFSTDGTFRQILSGEVWRLVSPIFLHFELMHIFFNLVWTYQFGLQIEPRRGSSQYLLMVIIIAAVSNAAQFWFTGTTIMGHWYGNPWFGGLSGVVYGLFGYTWIRGKLDPGSGLGLPQQTVFLMLLWHVLCVMGVIPKIANWAHGIGLVAGIAFALLDSLAMKRRR